MSHGRDGRLTEWTYDALAWVGRRWRISDSALPHHGWYQGGARRATSTADGRQVAGGALLGGSLLALLAFAGETKRIGGGVIGDNLALLLNHYAAELVCALLLLVIGIVGVFLLTRTDPRRLLARSARHLAADSGPATTPVDADPSAVLPRPPRSFRCRARRKPPVESKPFDNTTAGAGRAPGADAAGDQSAEGVRERKAEAKKAKPVQTSQCQSAVAGPDAAQVLRRT